MPQAETEAERQERQAREMAASFRETQRRMREERIADLGRMGQGAEEKIELLARLRENPEKLAEAVRRFGQATRAGRKISGLAGKEAFVRSLLGASPRKEQEDPRGIHAMNQKIQQDYQKGIGAMITALVRSQTSLAGKPQEAMKGISDALRMITSATNAEASSVRSVGQRDKADTLDRKAQFWVNWQGAVDDVLGRGGRSASGGSSRGDPRKTTEYIMRELGNGDKANIVNIQAALGRVDQADLPTVYQALEDSKNSAGATAQDQLHKGFKAVVGTKIGRRTNFDSNFQGLLETHVTPMVFPESATTAELDAAGLADDAMRSALYQKDPTNPDKWVIKPGEVKAIEELVSPTAIQDMVYGKADASGKRTGGLMAEFSRRGVPGASLWGDAYGEILGKLGAGSIEELVEKFVSMYTGADDGVTEAALAKIEDQLGLERGKMKAPEAYVDPITAATRDIHAVPEAPGLPAKYGKVDDEKFWRQQGRRQLRADAGREGARKRIISELGTLGEEEEGLPTAAEKKEKREEMWKPEPDEAWVPGVSTKGDLR